jgi:biotin-[acetyl-CoA-carboxylase] ligase BirA-like protein
MMLNNIAEKTRKRVEDLKKAKPFAEIKMLAESLPKDSAFEFEKAISVPELSFICEVKKASPSKGVIAADFPYTDIAREYEKAGAAAISVLTEPYFFLGSDLYLTEISKTVNLPILRKDFTIDPYQIYEAKTIGASAVLLICALLNTRTLAECIEIADSLGLSAVTEVHDENEIKSALDAKARIIGVNNRDLKTFEIDIETSVKLRKLIPDNILFVAESGIKTREDILRLSGANAVLIGETLMRSVDKKSKIESLRGLEVSQRISLDECESTHKYVRENFENLQEWAVVTAEYQTNGRGRHGRAWVAPKGKNLCFSLILPAKNLKPEFYAPTTQIAAITIAKMLKEKGINANVKWPNDILVNKRKICGIISELLGTNIHIGVGINVNTEESDFAELDRLATSIFMETGKIWDREALLQEFLGKFKVNFEILCKNGLLPFIEDWRKMGCFAGHKAKLMEGDSVLDGTIESIKDDGSLLFRTEMGLKTIWSGDLEI